MNHNPEKPLARSLSIQKWMARRLEVAYWLGLSETRQVANETTTGLMPIQPNDY